MNTPSKLTLVVGYDFSAEAELALDRAIGLAGGVDTAALHIVAALGGSPNPDFPAVSKDLEGTEVVRARLAAIVEGRLATLKPPSVHAFVHVWLGGGSRAILRLAGDVESDLIVVGTHSKKGLARAVLGSVSEKVVRSAMCPVLVVRQKNWEHTEETIEPPCERCRQTRESTSGASWWCEFHDHSPPYASPLRSHVQHNPEEARRLAWPIC